MLNTNSHNPYKKNGKYIIGNILTILEGLMASTVNFAVFILVVWILEDNLISEKVNGLTKAVVICFVLRFVLYGIGYTCGQIGGARISKQIRLFLGEKCKRISLKQFSTGHTGTYINVLTDNVAKYERTLTHKVPNLIKNGAISVMLICFASYIYLPAGIILSVAALLFLPEMKISFWIGEVYGGERNIVYNKTVSQVVEYIEGIQTLRAYGISGTKNRNLTKALRDFSNINYRYEAKGIPVSVVFNLLQWLSLPAVMLISEGEWVNGNITDSQYLMLCMVPILLVKLLMVIAVDVFSFKDMSISQRYINEIINLDEEASINEDFEPTFFDIELKNVEFAYEKDIKILEKANAVFKEGTLNAVVGDSGSGKSTIMNLISKYYDVDAGTISIGGLDLKNYSSEKVLSKISLVDQDVFLFNTSIKENIRYARKDATDDEIIKACKLANCDEFISKLDNKYDSMVGENGCKLSGGERQRLSIARAIVRNSPIVLLDEATASLDIENELKVKQAIQNLLTSGKTVIMIAHTLPIIKNADMIFVVNNNTIRECGTHEQLLAQKGKYYRMWTAK